MFHKKKISKAIRMVREHDVKMIFCHTAFFVFLLFIKTRNPRKVKENSSHFTRIAGLAPVAIIIGSLKLLSISPLKTTSRCAFFCFFHHAVLGKVSSCFVRGCPLIRLATTLSPSNFIF